METLSPPLSGKDNILNDNEHALMALLNSNQQRLEQAKQHRFFHMLSDGSLNHNEKRHIYMDNLEIWTIRNQMLLFARQATCVNKKYEAIFLQHLSEEIGHEALYDARKSAQKGLQDAVIEAIAAWFILQMFVRDNIEKVVLIHLVIENASDYYHELARPILMTDQAEAYYEAHKVDSVHAQMGVDMLKGESATTYQHLMPLVNKGWDMMQAMFDRIVYLVDHC